MSNRLDEGLIGIEKTTELITSSAYKYIRHPLYSSLFWLTWGVFFKSPSFYGLVLALAASIFLIITAKFEEIENIEFFGKEYLDYMKRTKRFVPFIY